MNFFFINVGIAHERFMMNQSTELVKKAYAGYNRAEELGENYNPDLHYNRAQLRLYDEQVQCEITRLSSAKQH